MCNSSDSIWDENLFRQNYDAYYKALVVFAMKFIVSQELAEDIVQDVFFSVWEHRVEMRNKSTFRSYLFAGVRNRCIDSLRRGRVESSYIRDVTEANRGLDNQTLEEIEEDIFTEEVFIKLFESIDKLSPRQREMLKLNMEGKKLTEIAEMLSVSYDTVKTQKKRAIEALRKALGGDRSILLYILFAYFFSLFAVTHSFFRSF